MHSFANILTFSALCELLYYLIKINVQMAFDTKNIKNVVMLGHSGSGKTSLCEAMLFEAKEIDRIGTIDGGSTTSDFTNI